MRAKASWIAGLIALAICLVCPIVDLFDRWDHAFLTGNDSEYPLVILALCVGLSFALARLDLRLSSHLPVFTRRIPITSTSTPFSLLMAPALAVFAPGSPPSILRI